MYNISGPVEIHHHYHLHSGSQAEGDSHSAQPDTHGFPPGSLRQSHASHIRKWHTFSTGDQKVCVLLKLHVLPVTVLWVKACEYCVACCNHYVIILYRHVQSYRQHRHGVDGELRNNIIARFSTVVFKFRYASILASSPGFPAFSSWGRGYEYTVLELFHDVCGVRANREKLLNACY